MDVRHPLYQAIASVLAGILILNPIVAAAAELAVDAAAGGNTHLGAAGNGVPVVNIATPNGAGLSHNKFSDYNVGQNGLILNNAIGKTQPTQLGGIIVGNPNLKGGAANKILNEVTGANPSQLRGYTEVAGQAAHVIVANPHGITCNGCGFINTPRATLTTGKPLMDGERLRGYDIDGGEISVEGAGLNTSNLDQFELITRSAKLNADLYAQQLAVVTGRNQVDAETLAATAKADDGSAKPQLAIDSSALGGMYAGAIRLVGTEQGVGVKLAGNMAASGGDIQIDANGRLSLAQTSTAGSLRAKASDIALSGAAYASDTVNLQASGTISVDRSLAAAGQVQLKAAQLSNDGQIVSGIDGDRRIAGQGLEITADNIANRGRLDATGSANITAGAVDNAGQLYADRIALSARTSVDNRGTLHGREVGLTAAQLNNFGASAQLIAEQSLLLNAPGIANLGGLVRFGDNQAVELNFTNLDNHGGRLEVKGGSLTFRGGTLSNQQGAIVGGTASIDVLRIDNGAGLIGTSQGDLALTSRGELNNTGGKLQAARDLNVKAGVVDNRAGTLVGNHLDLTGSSLDNRDQGVLSAEHGNLTLNLGGVLDNANGLVQSSGSLLLDAGSVNNLAGQLLANSLTLTAQGAVNNNGGILDAGKMSVIAQRIDNQNGRMQAQTAALEVTADDLKNNQGVLLGKTLSAKLGSLSGNTQGTVSADGQLRLVVRNALVNALGRLQSVQGDVDLTAGSLDNRQGVVIGRQLLLSAAEQLDNRGGRIVGDGIQADAKVIDNSDQGLLVAGTDGVSLIATQRLSSNKGRIQSEGNLEFQAPQLENRGGVVLGKRLEVRGSHLDNGQGGALVSDGDEIVLILDGVLNNATGLIDAGDQSLIFNRAVSSLDNQGGTLRGERIDLLAGALDNSSAGRVLAGASGLALKTGAVNNQRGLIYAQGGSITAELGAGSLQNQAGTLQGDTVKVTAADLDNSLANGEAGIISSLLGKLELLVDSLTNRGGQVFAKGDLSVSGQHLDNAAGQISGASMDLSSSGALDNQNGLIESAGALVLNSGTLDNSQGGRLRALGGDSSRIHSNLLLNNQGGSIGVASQAFELSSGAALLNAQGQVQHAGTGLFRLSTVSLTGAGTLTGLGSGLWQLGSLSGVGQMRLNGALDLRVDQGLDIGAAERIASASGLTLTAASLNNQGELLSDGDLLLSLGGDAHNAGTLSAQHGLTLTASNFTQQNGRLASGLDTQLNLSGYLDNRGWLIANQALRVSADQVINSGTLGALGVLSLTGVSIANGPDSLLFSGGDMTLRATSLNNRYGDFYSQGALDFAGLDGGRAQSFSNRSGTIEAQGDIRLNVASLENVRDIFDFEQTTSFGEFDVRCGQHCGGGDSFKRGKINVNETIDERITQNSPAAWLTAGRNLTIDAGSVENRNSTIAANGDLTISADSLLNQGSSSRTGSKTLVINTVKGDYGKIPTGQWDAMESLADQFNASMAQGIFDKDLYDKLWTVYGGDRWIIGSPVITWTDDGSQTAPATLQAGNRVSLNVTQNLQNGTVAEYSLAQLTGQLAGSLLGQQTGTVNLTINKASSEAQARGPQSVETVTRTAVDGSQQVSFIPVDYTGVPFAAVDPTAADTYRLPQGQYGMFIRASDPGAGYLIETNPALTDLGKFLNSGYLLDKLGFDADKAWKRLGDGAYETRLIREAIQAQTGQRFLDGLASDYDQFQYLMDNALAAKEALKLSVGVGLPGEQVAALTHDIVWMESRVIDGQEVLVPVVYLAQTNDRNLRGNSLIQGRDLNLMAGGDLINVGTLRASNDLNAVAGGSILQGGLVDAGERVSLLAGDSIRNALAGQIRGDQVDLTALRGDIVNDRTAVTASIGGSEYRSFLDAGASIGARSDLSLDAARDITNRGALSSGGDAYVSAGRDINLEAVTDASRLRDVQQGGHHVTTTTVEQNHGSTLTAGGDLVLDAGRDLNVIGSKAKAGSDLFIDAGRDVAVVSATDRQNVETRSKHGGTRNIEQQGQVQQQSSLLDAGDDVAIYAGRDLAVAGSQVRAAGDVALDAERDIAIVASTSSQEAYFYQKKKGSWGKSKTQMSESYAEANVDSVVQAGKDLTVNISKTEDGGIRLNGGRDLVVAGSQLQAGNDLMLGATRDIAILATEQDQASASGKSKSSTFGVSKMKEVRNSASTEQVGSILQGGNDTVLVAGRNVDVNASRIGAGRDVELHAGKLDATGDINIVAGSDSSSSYAEKQRSKWGISNSGNFVSINTASKAGNTSEQTVNAPSEIAAGRDVRMTSARDINVVGSNVAAERTVGMQADRDVNILPGESTSSAKDWDKKRQTGLGWKFTETNGAAYLGIDWNAEHGKQVDTAAAGSQIRAGEDLDIRAGRDIRQQGSDLDAGRDIRLVAGRDIVSDAGQDTSEQERVKRHQRASIGVQGSQSITTGIQNFGHLGDGETIFGKVSSVLKTIDGVSDAGASASIYVGANQEQSNREAQQYDARNSTLNAGRDIIAQAGRDITLQGTQADAGRNIVLDAGRDLSIQSSQSNYRSKDRSDSVSGSVGIGVGNYNVASQQGSSSIGSNSAGTNTSSSGIYGAGSVAWNNQEQNGSRQNNAHLNAGGDIDLRSGRDTLIAGASVAGGGVKIDVGRDLTVASVRDQDRIEGNGQSHSGSGGFGGGSGAISVSKTDGKRNWVGEQTRIQGRDSVDIYTEGHTQLDGAVIASNTGDLMLNTGTFGHSDLYDKDRYKSVDITTGMAYNSKENQDKSKTTNDQAQVPNKFISGSYEIRNAEQVNRATVGAGEIVVRDNPGQDLSGLNRDTDKAQELLKDEHKGEELYVSSNSVTKVGEALGIPQAMARRDLANGSAEERSAAARKLFQYQLKGDANSEAGQVVADALAEVAKRDPKGAEKILQILDSQQKLDLLVQNASSGGSGVNGRPSVTGVLLTVAGILASQGKQQSGDASGGDGLDPTTGVPTWTSGSGNQVPPNAVTMAAVAAMIAIIDPKLASGLYGTPIAQQDNLPLTTPAEDPALWKPGSGGYGADGKVDTPTTTGGSGIHQQGPTSTTSPIQVSDYSWVMISEGGGDLLTNATKQLDSYIDSFSGGKYKPATVVAAVDPMTGRVVTSSSGVVPENIAPELKEYADSLGGLGVKTSCGNTLGRCAEFRAANELLLSNPTLRVKDIKFTPAIRPRTGEVVPRCENCENIFGHE